jgi:hypothetical protein
LSQTRPRPGTLAPLFLVRVSRDPTGQDSNYLTHAVRRGGDSGPCSQAPGSSPFARFCRASHGTSASAPATLSQTRPRPGTIAPIFLVRVSRDHTAQISNYLTRAVRRGGWRFVRLPAEWRRPGTRALPERSSFRANPPSSQSHLVSPPPGMGESTRKSKYTNFNVKDEFASYTQILKG